MSDGSAQANAALAASTGRPAIKTAAVERFYNRNPFPGYAAGDTATTVLDRCRRSPFLDALDRSTAPDARVVDLGCGTGQLACFLALSSRRRTVLGVDRSTGPLAEASRFRRRVGIDNLHLLRADLFALPFTSNRFDLVVSRGVVHHTSDPMRAIDQVTELVAPGGYLVLGWYESYGRFVHRGRQVLARLCGQPLAAIDPILRQKHLDPAKRTAWIADQYYHPREVVLGLPAVLRQAESNGLHWLRTVPPAPGRRGLLQASHRPGRLGLFARQLGWLLRGATEPDAGLVSLVMHRPGP